MADKKKEIDNFGWHEALDRTDIISNNIEDYLAAHPVIIENQQFREAVDKIVESMRELYVLISNATPR